MNKKIVWAVLLATLPLFSGCTAYARREMMVAMDLHPLALERELGKELTDAQKKQVDEFDKQVMHEFKEADDPAAKARAEAIVARLLPFVHKTQLHPTVRILQSEQVNAFVAGGEYVYVFSQLLKEVESDDELAGILAHELGHVDAGHQSRGKLPQLLGQVTVLAAGALVKNKDAGALATVGAVMMITSYSREHEREADILGTIDAYHAGYDPEGLTRFFKRSLKKEDEQKQKLESKLQQAKYEMETACGSESPESSANEGCRAAAQKYKQAKEEYDTFMLLRMPIFRTHPVDDERIRVVTTVAEYLRGQRALDAVAEAPTVKKVLTVLNRFDNRKGAVTFLEEGRRFYAQQDWLAAEEQFKRALEIFPEYAEALTGLADVHMQWGRHLQAEQEYQNAIKIDPGVWAAYAGLGKLYLEQERYKEAAPLLKQAVRANNPDYFSALGKCYLALGNRSAAKQAFQKALSLDPGQAEAGEELARL